jgi:pyruvate dehydrogenase E2 component (dihydrolipoamide acetyltransferase)
MPVEVIFPRVDMDMTTGQINKWLAADGDKIVKGSVLFEIETDKAAMEIEAPADGILRDIRVGAGEQVAVGSLVARIFRSDEAYTPLSHGSGEAAPAAIPPAQEVIAQHGQAQTAVAVKPVETAATEAAALLRATPLARRLAQTRGIDLATISGSGPRGRVTSKDVEQHAARHVLPAKPGVCPSHGDETSARDRRDEPAGLVREPVAASGPADDRINRRWLGGKTGTPLVFIHGFGSDLTTWRAVWAKLGETAPILAIDLPGHGQSPAPSNGAGTSEDMLARLAAALLQVLREERIDACHLVAHSLGAAVALAASEAGAVQIRSLSLLAPAGLGPDINGAFIDGFCRATTEASLAPWLRQLFADPDRVTPGFVRSAWDGRQQADIRNGQRDLAHQLFPDGTQAVDLRPVLARIEVPAKIIWGLQDRIIPHQHAFGLPGRIALHLFPGVGHMPQIEVANTVASLIGELL